MNINIMLVEIWQVDTHWSVKYDTVRGIYMWNATTGVAYYADNVEDVVRKVWLSIYGGSGVQVMPQSHGMVKG